MQLQPTKIGRWLLASPSLQKGHTDMETELIEMRERALPILEDAGVTLCWVVTATPMSALPD